MSTYKENITPISMNMELKKDANMDNTDILSDLNAREDLEMSVIM